MLVCARECGGNDGRAYFLKKIVTFLGPAPWPSGQVCMFRFGGPGFHLFGSWMQTWHRSWSHAEVASHIAELEGSTTRIYNYVLEWLWGEEEQKIPHLFISDELLVLPRNLSICPLLFVSSISIANVQQIFESSLPMSYILPSRLSCL